MKILPIIILAASSVLYAADHDGDLLLDSWEAAYGISTNRFDTTGHGIGDYFDDPDHDGLPNHAEWTAGTDPTNSCTFGGIPNDYYAVTNSSTIGAVLTDNDHLEDFWEARHTPAVSMHVWDETSDWDGDGWDAWSERRAGTDPRDAANRPDPVLTVRVRYFGVRNAAGATLVVHAYTDPYMNGMPDAVYSVATAGELRRAGEHVLSLTSDQLVSGWPRQGLNYFYAWANLDGSTGAIGPTWTPGEPAGIADGHEKGIDIGWDRNEIRIGLTDEAKSFARLSWSGLPGSDGPQNTIALYPAAGGAMAFERTLTMPRTWLHEGDIIAGKTLNFGLPCDGAGTKVYRWTLNGYDRGFITNTYPVTMPTPILVDPKNDVIAARPVFRFRLALEATEFEIEIRCNTAAGPVLYTGRHLAPARTRFSPWAVDLCTWQFPYYAGEVLPSGQVFANGTYYWKLRGFGPAHTGGSAWTGQMTFSISPISTELTVDPYGARTPVTCSLWSNRAMTGTPVARGATTIRGMAPGLYYLSVFCDADADYTRDSTEQWGYHRLINDPVRPFEPAAILVRPGVPQTIHVYMMGP